MCEYNIKPIKIYNSDCGTSCIAHKIKDLQPIKEDSKANAEP